MCKVSIIVPVYNNQKFIEKCIRSLLRQTHEDLEIIGIDDGSQDQSGVILDRLAAGDSRLRVFHQKNGGVGSARNLGIEKATGDYLTFVDGDDYISKDYIEHLVQAAQGGKNPAEMVICGLTYVDETGNALKKLVPDRYVKGEHEEWTFRLSAVAGHFYRWDLWTRYGIRFSTTERGEDMPVALFFSAVCRDIRVLPEAGYYYVQHQASAMHHFRGLKEFRLPFRSLEDSIRQVQKEGIANGRDFHELFVLRILATCYFDLARGASRKDMDELCGYIDRILKTYYPYYAENRLARLSASVRVPFSQKAAVWLLIFLVKRGMLKPFSRLLTGRSK